MDIRDAIKANNTAIEAIDLVKDYGSGSNAVHALRDVNIAFEQGKFTVIMGPSGSGKSTLMHTLAGLDSATSGHVMFDGKDLTRMNDDQLTLLRRHQIGFIFQSFNLLPMFTAEQNILMPLTLAGAKPDRQWLRLLVETLGLKERLNHRPNELSGGQQQRVAIARALITKPKLVFADEPTGNLDSVSSAEVLSFLKRSVNELDQTIIMVTHDAVAASYADRALVFADGQIVADVNMGNRLKLWKMKPILWRRSKVSCLSSMRVRSAPPKRICPDVAESRPASVCISVDLPEPDGPMMAVNLPRSKLTFTPRRA